MYRKILVILLVLGAYFSYSFFVLKPQTLTNFSLIDDGQSIVYADYFKECFTLKNCDNLKSHIIEKQFGRFRPLYWALQSSFVNLTGPSASMQHQDRVYLIGSLLVILLVASMIQAKSDFLGILFGSAVFIGSYSFSENIIRLGPTEPFQLIFLSMFSLFYINLDKLISKYNKFIVYSVLFVLFLFLILIKETSVAIIPVVLLTLYLFRKKDITQLKFMGLTLFTGLLILIFSLYIAGKGSEVAYSSNYSINIAGMIKNFDAYFGLFYTHVGLVLKFVLVGFLGLLVFKSWKKLISNFGLIYWFLVFVFFSLILIPWQFILQRYLLITMFSFSVIVSVVTTELLSITKAKIKIKNKFLEPAFFCIAFIVISNIFFRAGYLDLVETINYQKWFTVFTQFEKDQVSAISRYSENKIYLNGTDSLDDWEVTYEIPIHLRYFYNIDADVSRISNLNQGGYLFSRSSFTPKFTIDELNKRFGNKYISDSKTYEVPVIDYVAFKNNFFYRPIQTLLNPPLSKDTLNYYWEIRKIN